MDMAQGNNSVAGNMGMEADLVGKIEKDNSFEE